MGSEYEVDLPEEARPSAKQSIQPLHIQKQVDHTHSVR